MNVSDNLSTLKRTRKPAAGSGRRAGPLVVLAVFVLGMALLFLLIFGDRLRPRIPVQTAPALLLESGSDEPTVSHSVAGSMVAQASGWIEPDPYPVHVPVKTDGFVEQVYVLEGQTVSRGDLLATLDPTNDMLRVDRLQAAVSQGRAAVQVQEQAVELAQAEVTQVKADLAAAQARWSAAVDRVERLQTLTEADRAEVELVAAERDEAEALSAVERLQAAATAAVARVEQERLKIAMTESSLTRLRAELSRAQIDLERTRVTAPVDGVVLKRYAEPGMKRMTGMDDRNSASIVSLYQPDQLQVRVDVPLSDIGKLQTGMNSRIVTAAFPGRVFTGRLTRITGEADITRNTLQVKVAIAQPDQRMRPEMLCRVEFISRPSTEATVAAGGGRRLVWIPEEALLDAENGSAQVWVVDPVEATVSLRDITTGTSRDGLRAVREGLRSGERVVIQGQAKLKPGALVSRQE